MKISSRLRERVQEALEEDVGRGDCTSRLFFYGSESGSFTLYAREDGIICGLPLAGTVFGLLDDEVEIELLAAEGESIRTGQPLMHLTAKILSVLQGERVFLNIIQRLSGIATRTEQYVQKTVPYGVTILDTRKTMPLWRELDKYAVRTGGGQNHRMGLYDMILVKDNHIEAAGGIEQALEIIQSSAPEDLPVEIEVKNLEEFKKALQYEEMIDYIMLDNMSSFDIQQAVKMGEDKVELEASGGITFDNIEEYARTGVQYISVGELTHSVKALDLSLLFSGN